jgi:hypothetical protein
MPLIVPRSIGLQNGTEWNQRWSGCTFALWALPRSIGPTQSVARINFRPGLIAQLTTASQARQRSTEIRLKNISTALQPHRSGRNIRAGWGGLLCPHILGTERP